MLHAAHDEAEANIDLALTYIAMRHRMIEQKRLHWLKA
jgi:hypothetical protein